MVEDYNVIIQGQRENSRINFLSESKGILQMNGIANVKISAANTDETIKL
jgi:hypothetical protein